MGAEFIVKTVPRDPGRVSTDFGMFFHAEKRVAGGYFQSEKKSKAAGGRHTVDLKARISMKFRHWPWSIFQNGPPVRVAPSDYEMFRILE